MSAMGHSRARRELSVSDGSIRVAGTLAGLCRPPASAFRPLLVAIHGGACTSRYFDVPGHSLVERAESIGLEIATLDRPSYGASEPLAVGAETIARNAEVLNDCIGDLWRQHGTGNAGVFVIGHSIGCAITVALAGLDHDWPLCGIAVSGIGLVQPAGIPESFASLPPHPSIDLPLPMKDQLMFGPAGSYDPAVLRAADVCHHLAPRAELIDITANWSRQFPAYAARVKVPVHYRLAEFDQLWLGDQASVTAVAGFFRSAPYVDARVERHVGHCIDLHHASASFQLGQLAFALRMAMPDGLR